MTDHASPAAPIDKPAAKSRPAILARLLRSRPSRPGESYGVPGQGESVALSVATIALLLAVWSFVTWIGWVKPLFVPAPWDIANKFSSTMRDGFTGSSLLTHIGVSTLRVFGAFALACVIGIPLGLAMGISSRVRGIFDPIIEFYRPIPPLAYLPQMQIEF